MGWGRHLALLALLAPCWVLPAEAKDCVKTLRRNPDVPHLVRLPDGERSGPLQAVLTEALTRMGCRVKVVDLPWARALTELKSGQLDVLPGMLRTEEREAYTLFSAEARSSTNRLYLRAGDPRADRLRQLDDITAMPFRLGTQNQVSHGPDFERLMREPAFLQRVQTVAVRDSLWRMLTLGRLDGVLADETMVGYELQRLGLQDQVQASAVAIAGVSTTTGFSRRNHDAAFVARFDQTLAAMRKDGSMAAIEKRMAAMLAQSAPPPAIGPGGSGGPRP